MLAFGWLVVAAGAAPWSEAETEHFVVFSDGGAHLASLTAYELERFHDVLVQVYPQVPPTPPGDRMFVVAFENRVSFAPYKPVGAEPVISRHTGGVCSADPPLYVFNGASTPRTSLQGVYVGVATSRLPVEPPLWLRNGMSEYFATLTSDGKRARVGQPPEATLQLLRSRGWVPLVELLAADRHSAAYGRTFDDHALFDAEAWLLVHWCLVDPEAGRALQLAAYLDAVNQGQPVATAVRIAFGMSSDAVTRELEGYAAGLTLPYQTVKLRQPILRALPTARAATPAEVDTTLGRVLLLSHRPDAARDALERAAAAAPTSPLPHEVLCQLASDLGDLPATRSACQEALRLGSTSARTRVLYARAALALDGAGEPDVAAVLAAAVELDPSRIEVYQLGVAVSLATGDRAAAARWVETGLRRAPNDPELRVRIAQLQVDAGQLTHALANLDRATAHTTDDHVLQLANEVRARLQPVVP